MRKALILALVLLPVGVAPMSAFAGEPVDNLSARKILAANYAEAEVELAQQLALTPNEPPALLNMGYVYSHTDRGRQARTVYSRVLALPNIRLDAADGRVLMSHDLARNGLRATTATAAR